MFSNNLYFSIIIPAYNEERYIAETIKHIKRINYPKNKYEIIVVNSSSRDKTYEISREFAGGNCRVYSIKNRGVSHARNFGLKRISNESNWIISLDADTLLKEDFLSSLNDFLINKESSEDIVIGTTEVQPISHSKKAKIWFKFYNLAHKYTKSSFSIQIIRRNIVGKVYYDERLNFSEDLKFIKDSLKYGKFFFFPTKSVYTSVRAFQKVGWTLLFLKWMAQALMPEKFKIGKSYMIIR